MIGFSNYTLLNFSTMNVWYILRRVTTNSLSKFWKAILEVAWPGKISKTYYKVNKIIPCPKSAVTRSLLVEPRILNSKYQTATHSIYHLWNNAKMVRDKLLTKTYKVDKWTDIVRSFCFNFLTWNQRNNNMDSNWWLDH